MYKLKVFTYILFLFLLIPNSNLNAHGTENQTTISGEHIEKFDTQIKINADSSINITENIHYDFESSERHGIFRDIPYSYKARGGNFKLKISDVEVTADSGTPSQFTQSRSGGVLKIKIGDPNISVSGEHDYTIKYKVEKAINYFEDHDELYWNITGNGWNIPIGKASALVEVANLDAQKIKTECFTGILGSTEKNCSTTTSNVNQLFSTTRSLNPQEGLTIVAGFPKGIVRQPTEQEEMLGLIAGNVVLALPLIVFFILYFVWRRIGKDPELGTVVAEYDSPNNLTPVELASLQSSVMQVNKIFAAQVIYLATRGHLKITRTEKEGWFGGEDFILEKINSEKEITPEDKKLLDAIFSSGQMISLSSFKGNNKTVTALLESFKGYKERFDSYGFYRRNTRGLGSVLVGLGIIGIILGIMLSVAFQNIYLGVAVVISAILFIIFGSIMPARTKEGSKMYARLLGLKKYIEVAEKDRINFHDAPEKSPEHFQKLLPFAILFGLEKKWAEKFEGLNVQPAWYGDSAGRAFSAAAFSSSMSNFSSAAASSMVTASSGGSGFSGGGSGGGGGGGGGGSW